MRKKCFLNGIVALLLGLFIYLFFNQNSIITRCFLKYIQLPNFDCSSKLGILLKNYVADFLWAYALCMGLQFVLALNKKRVVFIVFGGFLGIFYELLQLFGIAYGTFDVWDIVVYFVGSFISVIVIYMEGLYEKI